MTDFMKHNFHRNRVEKSQSKGPWKKDGGSVMIKAVSPRFLLGATLPLGTSGNGWRHF